MRALGWGMVDGDADADAEATLPHTGAGFPTDAARAFALFLLSVGGFPLTYRKACCRSRGAGMELTGPALS
jgi:hypothetical protein